MLTLLYSAMTELDAVNVMLASIGQAPVNTLTVQGIKDVSFAQLCLHNVLRAVQTRGWYFNREGDYPLSVTGDGTIPFPDNVLHADPVDRCRNLVERARKFYDVDRHTFDFTGETSIKVDVIWMLPYEELPQAARQYVATRAARVFQANNIGSEILYRFTKEEEELASYELQRAELRSTKPNALSSLRYTTLRR